MAGERKGQVMKRTLIGLLSVLLVAAVAAVVVPVSSGADGLTAAEIAELQYMREEEKLARDVYRAMAAEWPQATVFSRIAASEQRHMDAVKVVLNRYGIADPAAGKAAGRFTNPELQELYDELVAKGSRSLDAALGVGVTIERADIADLEKALEETGNPDLERLYGNLLRGSQNHLRAFTSHADGVAPQQRAGRQGRQGRQGATLGQCDGQQMRTGRGPGQQRGAGW
jgi:hypothetical protein